MARKDGKDRGLFQRKGHPAWWIRWTCPYGHEHMEKIGPKSLAREMYQRRKVAVKTAGFCLSASRQAALRDVTPPPVHAERHASASASARGATAQARYPSGFAQGFHRNKALYFVQCGEAVKIGVSSDPRRRMAALQTGAPGPLTLLAAIPQAGQYETWCHHRLAHAHLHGEWFRYTAEVDALIQELQA